MALRLRRGTNAERLLITPVEGELIYTTDTKLLYVGDGSTAGGTLVTGSGGGGGATSLEDLIDTDVVGALDNQVLTWIASTSKWEPTTIPGAGAIDLADLADVFLPSPEYEQVIYFDGLNWRAGNVQNLISYGSDLTINIVGEDSTRLVDVTNNTLTGDLTGNVTGDLFDPEGIAIVDHNLRLLVGNVNGNVTGDLQGSVFGADSTMLVNGLDSVLTGPVDTSSVNVSGDVVIQGTGGITINTEQDAEDGFNLFSITSSKETEIGSAIVFTKSRGTLAAPTALQDGDEIMGINYIGYDSDNSPAPAAVIQVLVDGTPTSGVVPGSMIFATVNSAGEPVPAITINAAQTVTLGGPAVLANYADDTARDAAITSPQLGMMIFHVANDTAQVYKSTGWVNI